MISIDQNCHSLWDVVPKLQALARHGHSVRHYIEDVDTAYTAMGAAGRSDAPRLARERFHRSGGADWGAAIFYSEFLGRQPVEIRDWEQYLGMKTNVLARSLGRDVDELYDEFSPSDNWQLIGSSFVGGRDHHRLIGDLSVAETACHLREMMDRAQADMTRVFPGADSKRRLDEWFSRERGRLEELLERFAGAGLVDLYRGWLGFYDDERIDVGLTSSLLAIGADENRTAILELFLRDYDLAAGLYNEAIAETSSRLRPLKLSGGELPFFATLQRDGRLVRTGVFLDGAELRIGERTFALSADRRLPADALRAGSIACMAGKAMLLTIQVRLGDGGGELALSYRGSLYMPAAIRLAEKLAAADLLPAKLHPIVRVRLRMFERMQSLKTPLCLPPYLAAAMGEDVVPAGQLGRRAPALIVEAKNRLENFKTQAGRQQWQELTCAALVGEIDDLDRRRRLLASEKPTPVVEIRSVWRELKSRQVKLLERTLGQVHVDYQTMELDFWDSRGAILPWCVALGGEEFYTEVIAKADIYRQ